jgi:hypothetical protein
LCIAARGEYPDLPIIGISAIKSDDPSENDPRSGYVMSTKTLSTSEPRTGGDLVHRMVDNLRAVVVAVSDARRAEFAYKSNLAKGLEPATAAAAAVLLDKQAA